MGGTPASNLPSIGVRTVIDALESCGGRSTTATLSFRAVQPVPSIAAICSPVS
jgi:hypothetical protein